MSVTVLSLPSHMGSHTPSSEDLSLFLKRFITISKTIYHCFKKDVSLFLKSGWCHARSVSCCRQCPHDYTAPEQHLNVALVTTC